ncbi:MAG TPA: GAF domain-containing protein, partial [Geothrix sp.]|nr:GAF domain-containing protein [Geothrix sp.]
MTGPLSAAAEEALVRLFEQTSISFHVMDREGHILHANAKFRSHLGLTEEDVRSVGFERLRHDLPPAEARTWFLQALDRAADQADMATWLRRDGVAVPVWVTVAGRRTDEGERLFIWGRDRSEEQLVTDRLTESADLQRHLAEGIYALSLTRTQEEAYQVLMGRASAILPGQHWFLGRVESEGGQRAIRMAAWIPDLEARLGPAIHGLNIPVEDSGFAREVYDLRRLCFVQDAYASPAMIHPPIAKAFGLRSLLGVPLVFEGRLTGVLFAASFQDEPAMAPRESQFSVLQSLARIAALALERIQAEARLEKAAGLASSLAAAVRDLAAET